MKFPKGYKHPTNDELVRKEFCKYHGSFSHLNNNCLVFRNYIQRVIEKGLFKFVEERNHPTEIEDRKEPISTFGRFKHDKHQQPGRMRKPNANNSDTEFSISNEVLRHTAMRALRRSFYQIMLMIKRFQIAKLR